ncbi:hypothetical protein PRN20_01065 [Devosia sp. ZB163]|uniref:hypothetical protein n=1 Tax=Devosia sp. ZB163 TaxID=3025938 RepID=UPI00235F6416|nr:hypothetical protein [Devosia sp. ZB163]MDC9822306.1 hypothetical protein [Devosia sp. ZB163]
MGEVLSDTVISFRLKRAEEFARQWRINARRLQSLASSPQTPEVMRSNALGEARTAAEIVGRRGDEMAAMAKDRGFNTWESDPLVAPVVVEIRAVENALTFAAEALSKRA